MCVCNMQGVIYSLQPDILRSCSNSQLLLFHPCRLEFVVLQLPFHSVSSTVAGLKCATWLCLGLIGSCPAQYMEGGDLHKALARDVKENGTGASRRLSWYGRGHRVLVDIASGLTYLHSEQVRIWRT